MERNLPFKLVFSILILLCGRGIAHAQVKVDVMPKVVLANPYQQTTFRFRWQIEPHEDNRRYALSYGCGKELHSSQREIDKTFPKTSERYVDLTVLEDCFFLACVVRVTEGKAKTLCSHQVVPAMKGEP